MTLEFQLSRYTVVLFDVDGVLRRGSVAIPQAAETLVSMRQLGIKVGVVTNNSTRAASDIQHGLMELGIHFHPEEIISAVTATGAWLAKQGEGRTAYVIGSEYIVKELECHGINVVSEPLKCDYKCDYLVVGACQHLGREVLTPALRVALNGACFVAINQDRTYPGEDGLYPAAGAAVGAVSGMLGREPDVVIGKPSPLLGKAALERFAVAPEACLMVGDTLQTDIAMGRALGMDTALVLTGNDQVTDITPGSAPTYVFASVAELIPV